MSSGKAPPGLYPTQQPMFAHGNYQPPPPYHQVAHPGSNLMYSQVPTAPPQHPVGPPPPYVPPGQPHYGQVYAQPQGTPGYSPYYTQVHYPQMTSGAAPSMAVIVPDAFNAGARFDGIARPSIPPPPPGVAPNAAQVAAMQGSHVILGQKQNNVFGGGAGGGLVFW